MTEKNATVEHPQFGNGIVTETRYNGFEIYVRFESGIDRWVRVTDVVKTWLQPAVETRSSSEILPQDEQLFARKGIEALRLGIVPYDQVEDLTFGRGTEIQKINKWLHNRTNSSLFCIGEYGAGKSHLLAYLFEHALKNKYAVAFAEIDPKEASFANPRRVYKYLVKSFCYLTENGERKGFKDFLSNAILQGLLDDHMYYSILKKINEPHIWEWLMANGWPVINYYLRNLNVYSYRDIHYPGLYDHTTAANVYCYMLSGLGWAASHMPGLKGLVLIFDEVENIDLLSNYYLQKAKNMIKAIIRTANSENGLDTNDAFESGLNYSFLARDVPFLYKKNSGLKLAFGFTPGYYSTNLTDELIGIWQVPLHKMNKEALALTFSHIQNLYSKAYSFSQPEIDVDYILNKLDNPNFNLRAFVKASVETLDIQRFNHI